MHFIQGHSREQINLLPDILDDYVGEDNPVRVIDAYIDSLDMKSLGFAKSEANSTGRPMYSPYDMLKLYLYGYINGVRSSRKLEEETYRNIEVMWLLGKLHPDHKTIARFRHDNAIALKNVFRDFTKLCLKCGLYGCELIAIDGSKFKAVNSKDRNFNRKKLADRIDRIDEKIEAHLQALADNDEKDNTAGKKSAAEITELLTQLQKRQETYKNIMADLANKEDAQISLTDSDSRLMIGNGKMDVCYNIQTATDSKNGLIVEFEAISAPTDRGQLYTMAQKAKGILERDSISVCADKGYDSVPDIIECAMNQITPHVAGTDMRIYVEDGAWTENYPLSENEVQDRCTYLRERNLVLCTNGNILYPRYYRTDRKVALYYNQKACSKCKNKCTTGKFLRFEVVMKQETFSKCYNDRELQLKQIQLMADRKIVKERKAIAEHPFGTVKRAMGATYCLMRGREHVNGEFSLQFLAFNMKRAINLMGVIPLIKVIRG